MPAAMASPPPHAVKNGIRKKRQPTALLASPKKEGRPALAAPFLYIAVFLPFRTAYAVPGAVCGGICHIAG